MQVARDALMASATRYKTDISAAIAGTAGVAKNAASIRAAPKRGARSHLNTLPRRICSPAPARHRVRTSRRFLNRGMPGRYYRRALDCPGQLVSMGSAGLAVILISAQWW
jgi:hypothetical protein